MFGTGLFGQVIFGQVSGRPSSTVIRVPVRSLTDEQIMAAIADGYMYFEVYFYRDRDTDLRAVSSTLDLDRIISLYQTFTKPSHCWLMVPRLQNLYTDAIALPTTMDDLLRIKELYEPMWNSLALTS